MPDLLQPFAAWALGLGTGLGLIVAIGAQNAYLLRLGATAPRRAVLVALAICTASDVVLIAGGTAGVGELVHRLPIVLDLLRWAGAAFLVAYGLLAARRALRPAAGLAVDVPQESPHDSPRGSGPLLLATRPTSAVRMRTVVVTVLAFTWLNPHVYLDTVLFVGSLANQQPAGLTWWWAAGAMCASAVWFGALGLGARLLRPVLARPRSWQVLDGGIAVLMLVLALRLALA